jgi:hypothetical protein
MTILMSNTVLPDLTVPVVSFYRHTFRLAVHLHEKFESKNNFRIETIEEPEIPRRCSLSKDPPAC